MTLRSVVSLYLCFFVGLLMARLMLNLWAIIPVAVTHNNMTDDERSREQYIKLNKDRMFDVAFWELSS